MIDQTKFKNMLNPKKVKNCALIGGGGGGKMPHSNLAISSQMTMKLGKLIIWAEIFAN